MASNTKPDTLREWAETIQQEGRGLTKWEEQFAGDMLEKLDNGWSLSERQQEVLERIYAEKTK